MVLAIGRSTDPATANTRLDVTGSDPASFRYCNPGAQYPSAAAARFGQLGYGKIGGGHKISRFPSPVNGAAANFDLLSRNYVGMSIGSAGKKWTGANGFGVPGYDPDRILTAGVLEDPKQAIDFLKAIAGRESGKGNNLTETQWHQSHDMFQAGSADAYLDGRKPDVEIQVVAGSKTGAGLLKRAREHIGQPYQNVLVPKDRADWNGPWDCAEFVSWVVYQEAQLLYGCTDDTSDPSVAEAYTGAWRHDAQTLGVRVSVEEAASTVGGIVLRYPPGPGKMGHIAICDGKGGTVEAKGRRYGVVADVVSGRQWDVGILIPGIEYEEAGDVKVLPPSRIYALNAANMDQTVVSAIEAALVKNQLDPGPIDGRFTKQTQRAVTEFQQLNGLVVDGEVGPETAAALDISLVAGANEVQQPNDTKAERQPENTALSLLVRLLQGGEKPMTGIANSDIDTSDVTRVLLTVLLQAALSNRGSDSASLLRSLLSEGAGDGKPKSADKEAEEPDLVQLLLPLLYKRVAGTTQSVEGASPKTDSPQKALQPAISRPSVQLSVVGIAVTSILQAIGVIGTPFGLGAIPTAAGTLATLIPALTGLFGATNGFSSLFGGLRKVAGGLAPAT
ncbi:peptidoglycan-binding domain-containing protein [Rhizobium sp. S152]|uniref:peptidoglycan-binding domain-containing protein n=1 Tax=Rhizobium sp. S152 TaxID=3055038 RepID=UPI0025A93901|nr:peptidoglycan-binding domain-containing protein [Rhizobium sp. S152]MDM9628512.1 peptidoglycan-binding domain-containing protein [Rhizobium sp. S152]